MTDIDYWDSELTKKLEELETSIGALKKVFGGDKEEVSAGLLSSSFITSLCLSGC